MPSVHHITKHRQERAEEVLSGAQDETFFDSQLKRAISLALSAVGFDGVKPTALEAFRGDVEQYMLHFLSVVQRSMTSNRRTQPIPQDFAIALAQFGVKPHELYDQLALKPPPDLSQPPILPAPHDDPPPIQIDGMLGPQLAGAGARQKWMPAHLPELPSKHTWKSTPIITKREEDAREIRERATEEGVLAEKAMRKLLHNGGFGNARVPFTNAEARKAFEDTMAEFERVDDEQRAREDDAEFEGFGDKQVEHDSAMLVNYERRYWRQAAQNT